MRKYVMFLVKLTQGAVSVTRVVNPCSPMSTSSIFESSITFIENNEHLMVYRGFTEVAADINCRLTCLVSISIRELHIDVVVTTFWKQCYRHGFNKNVNVATPQWSLLAYMYFYQPLSNVFIRFKLIPTTVCCNCLSLNVKRTTLLRSRQATRHSCYI